MATQETVRAAAELPRVEHPLEPLSVEEVSAAAQIVRQQQGLGERHKFAGLTLDEPRKDDVLAFRAGDDFERRVRVVVLDGSDGSTYEGVVSLSAGSMVSWEHLPDVQPPVVFGEFDECEAACKADPDYQEALRKRGITDLDKVLIDPWSAGSYGDEGGRRLSRALTWVHQQDGDNAYAHPVDNLVTVVDLNAQEVVRVEDYGIVPVPQESGQYTPNGGPVREDLKPYEVSQPEGPSFEVRGHEIRWQKWQLRIGFTPREGLVLHTVGYEDQGRLRPVLYRASLSEMVVPYGDPRPGQWRKNAFDAGEYNIGALANSLALGCDCLGEIRYFDGVLSDEHGEPMVIRNAICLHEEDTGVLWKHYDMRTEETEVRRSRRLVISWISTVANYEYAFYWYLYQDGTIEFEGKLTGIVSTGALPPGETTRHGQLLNPDGLYGPIHQHFFNFRLDMDVDGRRNQVYEVHTESVPRGEENPRGNAFFTKATLLRRESEAQQTCDQLTARHWRVVNPDSKNRLGEPVAYRLTPHGNVMAFAQPDAEIMRRIGFTTKHLWATQYEPTERHAAGEYPNQSKGGEGLPEWTKADRELDSEDVVLWYTLGSHHAVRPEDWPVMPVQRAGFLLEPQGFFDRNPALDVPRPENGHCGPAGD